MHGAGGGFDQGLEIASPLVQAGYRVIAMSRFGYLRTPLPVDASPAAQADAHACLLDALGVRRVAVVGASAGAPSSMQFALRHPERTACLALLVPAAYPSHIEQRRDGAVPIRSSSATKLLFDTALRSDFLFWVAPRVARNAMLQAILGTPPSVLKNASAEERARVAQVLDHIQPLSMRRLGLLNDASIVGSLPRYELERIAAPTLILGMADCLYGTYPGARYSAEHIPGARLIDYPTGGHLWVGHHREVLAEIAGFLRNAAWPAAAPDAGEFAAPAAERGMLKPTMSATWSCPKCKRRFTRKNQRHACGTGSRLQVLRGRPESLVALYHSLESFARTLGPVEFVARDRYVLFRSIRIFADLVVMTDALRVAVHLGRRVADPIFFKIGEDRKRVTHVALLRDETGLSALKPYLREAYEFSVSSPSA